MGRACLAQIRQIKTINALIERLIVLFTANEDLPEARERQQLIERDSQGEDVSRWGIRIAHHPLGRHVGR